MGESLNIQLTTALLNQLSNDTEQVRKKSRKPKAKPRRDSPQPQVKAPRKIDTPTEWPPQQPPIFVPVPVSPSPPPTHSTLAELDAIRSVLQESERVVERLQTQEQAMLQEVTQRAKELHDKEFKPPNQNPVRCLAERDASFNCYKVHTNDPLKCANAVKSFQECARRVRQLIASSN